MIPLTSVHLISNPNLDNSRLISSHVENMHPYHINQMTHLSPNFVHRLSNPHSSTNELHQNPTVQFDMTSRFPPNSSSINLGSNSQSPNNDVIPVNYSSTNRNNCSSQVSTFSDEQVTQPQTRLHHSGRISKKSKRSCSPTALIKQLTGSSNPLTSIDEIDKRYLANLSREERRRIRRATVKYRTAHASRERLRVEAFSIAFTELRKLLPTLPHDKKLSKIEILRLAIAYISYLDHLLASTA